MSNGEGRDTDGAEEPSLSISKLVFRFGEERADRELDEFREAFERKFGPTDLTKRYTSTLPAEAQQWLARFHPKRYWIGLPPFVQAYFKEKAITAHRHGRVDDLPSGVLELYLSGAMEIGGDSLSR